MEEHNKKVIEKYVSISNELLLTYTNLENMFDTINRDAVQWKSQRKLKYWKQNTGKKILLLLHPFVSGGPCSPSRLSPLRDVYENIMFNEFLGDFRAPKIGGVNPLHVFYGNWGSSENTVIVPVKSSICVHNPTRPTLKDIHVILSHFELLMVHIESVFETINQNKYLYRYHYKSKSSINRYMSLVSRTIKSLRKIQHDEAIRVIFNFVAIRTLPTGTIDNLLYKPPNGLMFRRSLAQIKDMTSRIRTGQPEVPTQQTNSQET